MKTVLLKQVRDEENQPIVMYHFILQWVGNGADLTKIFNHALEPHYKFSWISEFEFNSL